MVRAMNLQLWTMIGWEREREMEHGLPWELCPLDLNWSYLSTFIRKKATGTPIHPSRGGIKSRN